jgi:hypothetical protein
MIITQPHAFSEKDFTPFIVNDSAVVRTRFVMLDGKRK